MRSIRGVAVAGSLGLVVAGVTGCADQPTAPAPAQVHLPRPAFNLGPGGANLGEVIVCTTGSGGSFSVTFSENFSASNAKVPPLGDAPNPYTLTLANPGCVTIWERPTTGITFDPNVRVAVAHTGNPAGFTFSSVTAEAPPTNFAVANQSTRTGTVEANMYHDARVTFAFQPAAAGCDFVTFGGFVEPQNVSYGGNAGVTRNGVLFGELNFKRHTNGDHIHLHTISSYAQFGADADTRRIVGPATINGVGGFTVTAFLTDNGEPGTSDRIRVVVSGPSGEVISDQTIDGGNIQLHHVCRPAPLSGPTQ